MKKTAINYFANLVCFFKCTRKSQKKYLEYVQQIDSNMLCVTILLRDGTICEPPEGQFDNSMEKWNIARSCHCMERPPDSSRSCIEFPFLAEVLGPFWEYFIEAGEPDLLQSTNLLTDTSACQPTTDLSPQFTSFHTQMKF